MAHGPHDEGRDGRANVPDPAALGADVVVRELSDVVGEGAEASRVSAWRTYSYEVLRWNRRVPLVSRRRPGETIVRLVRESMAMWEVASHALGREPRRAIDVGTGAGFPGLVWRLAHDGLEVVLVERRERKAAFLDHVTARLGLEGVEVEASDAAELPRRRPELREAFDVAVGLAVAPPERLVPLLRPFVGPHGIVVTTVRRDARVPVESDGLRLAADDEREEARVVVYAHPA